MAARLLARTFALPALALALAVLTVAPAPALAAAASSGDSASTHAYLTAAYAYDQASVANLASSKATFEGLANTLASECAGVLAGVPPQRFDTPPGGPPQTARGLGEARRREQQLDELRSELSGALVLVFAQPDRQAAVALAGAVAPLSWSSPAITQLVHRIASERVQALELAPPSVCADMRAWAASGYKTLAPATKQLLASLRAQRAGAPKATLDLLLRASEGPAEKHLEQQVEQLTRQLEETLRTLLSLSTHLQDELGFPPSFEEIIEPSSKRHLVGIGHGKTAAGGRFTVSAEVRPKGEGHLEPGCRGDVEIKEVQGHGNSSGSSGDCVGSGAHPQVSVNCNEGLLAIHANTLPRTRSVILRLSNGRRIRSDAVLLPKRLGGPAGLYYQVVHGPSPIPVSLTELDAHGHRLRSESLPRVVECTKHALRLLPHGLRTIARDAVPQGPAFSIIGQHYRFLGRTYFEIDLRLQPLTDTGSEEEGTFAGSEVGGIIQSSSSFYIGHKLKPGPFSPQFQTECQPHQYAIVYGLLKSPGATVLAQVSGKLQELHIVQIPASLHAGGTLAYAVLSTVPEALITRSAQGKTIATEELGPQAGKATTETCEGEAE